MHRAEGARRCKAGGGAFLQTEEQIQSLGRKEPNMFGDQRRGQYGWSSGGQDAIAGETKVRQGLEDFMF